MILMSDLYRKLGRVWVVIISGILAAGALCILSLLIQRAIPPDSPGIIAMELAFSKKKLVSILNQWGAEGVGVYLKAMWIDYFYALFYAIFLSSLFALASTEEKKKPMRVELLIFSFPFIAGILDWVENSFHLAFFPEYEEMTESLVLAVSFVSLIKWFLALFVILAILYSFLRKVVLKMKK